ncbi:nitroreductase family protein [Hydrogenophaga sp. SL48]|uniref:nitroreductase family protein n=1 Tax=Hydrogenophaga sp. SL48 TaxID=2806347 RepID=UPI001F31D1A7|nr:nitroreductase family protein [Hydrogenophaga sp. SL48]UJW82621.1 nitroreductase family protein [Hydrogenophaga sp. SL48]
MSLQLDTCTEALELIRARVSTSHFNPAFEIDDDLVADLIAHACEAPSAYHLQNWRFIAVKSATGKEKLCQLAYGQQQVINAAVTVIVIGTLNGHERIRDNLQPLVDAGHMGPEDLEAWASDTHRGMHERPVKQRDEAIRSASLAAMNLMTAAQALGLASAPMGGFDAVAVSAEFGIEATELPVMLVAIGRPAPGNWPRKPRRPVAEVLSFV